MILAKSSYEVLYIKERIRLPILFQCRCKMTTGDEGQQTMQVTRSMKTKLKTKHQMIENSPTQRRREVAAF